MDALFACTKCRSRHPFEDLSAGKQLCKSCRNDFPVVKCTYCRAEFQHEEKNGTSSICKKCAHNVKHYGKPKACEYCNIIAAFIGNKCQRCANCEKKYGLPLTCDQCKQQCAFDRQDGSRKKVDGKLLCWLCTMAYKRVLAKTKGSSGTPSGNGPNQDLPRSSSVQNSPAERVPSSTSSRLKASNTCSGNLSSLVSSALSTSGSKESKRRGSRDKDSSSNNNKLSSSSSSSSGSQKESSGKLFDKQQPSGKSQDASKHKEGGTPTTGVKRERERDKEKSSGSSGSSKLKTESGDIKTKDVEGVSIVKKPKLDKSSNGISQNKSSDDQMEDYTVSDNVVAFTQLREEVETLKKQLQGKDQQILDRDKKLTELKAKNYEAEKEMRNKVTNLQKMHTQALNTLQEKNRELQKQIAALSKSNKGSS